MASAEQGKAISLSRVCGGDPGLRYDSWRNLKSFPRMRG